MIDIKNGWAWNVNELVKMLEDGGVGGEPAAAIPDASEGTEIQTINAILAVLRTRNIIAAGE